MSNYTTNNQLLLSLIYLSTEHETLLDLAENEWRIRACGRMCFVLPLWLYCDDTSGNVSKKWNEHNSVLMCLAGLQSSHLSLPFEIHFLTTSNLAPPTEMFEGVSDEMRYEIYCSNSFYDQLSVVQEAAS